MNLKAEISNNSSNDQSRKSFENNDIRYQPTLVWTKALLWGIVGSLSFGFIYACFARIDEVVVARGELQAKGAERPIKSSFDGIIDSIEVSEGQRVKSGQVLIRLNSNIYEAQREGTRIIIDSLYKTLNLKKQIFSEFATLHEKGAISKIDYLNQKNIVQEIESKISQEETKLKEIDFKISNTILVTPVNGVVFNLIPSSPGYVANNGETLLKIVPEGFLEAKVFLTNADIGFVRPEMKAQIRVDAFPFTQFGTLTGKIKSLGQEVLPADQQNPQPRFPVYVKINSQYLENNGRKIKVRSGQSVSVNLIVRDKPVISLLTDALEKSWDSLRRIKSSSN